jgi:hypothetical protein
MGSPENSVEILDGAGAVIATFSGPKSQVARGILRTIHDRLIEARSR